MISPPFDIFFGNGAYNDLNSGAIESTAAAFSSGDITIIDADTRTLATTSSTRIQIAQFDLDYGWRLSSPIFRKNPNLVTRYKYLQYAAPVLQLTKVGIGSATIVAGVTYQINIVNQVQNYTQANIRKLYQHISKDGTDTELATALAAQINADLEGIVIAVADSGGDLYLTAKDERVVFTVTDAAGFTNLTISNVNNYQEGNGTFLQVGGNATSNPRGLEYQAKGYKGIMNHWGIPDAPRYYADSTLGYKAFTGPTTVGVTSGSATVTSATIITDSGTGNIAVGDYIKIVSGTTTYYRVIAVTSTTAITLDRAFEGTTAASLAIANVSRARLYDMYVIEHGHNLVANDQNFVKAVPCVTYIAIKAGATNAANFKTLLDSLMPS